MPSFNYYNTDTGQWEPISTDVANPITADLLSDDIKSELNEIYSQGKNVSAPNNYDGAVVSFIDDDGTISFLDNYKPLLDIKGIKATIACVTGQVGASDGVGSVPHMSLSQLLTLQSEGFEISSHSVNHQSTVFRDNVSTTPDSTFDYEMGESQKWLKDNGFTGYDKFIFPYGSFASDQALRLKKIARKYYKYALNAVGAHNSSPCDNMYLNRTKLSIDKDFTTVIKPIIDSAVTNKGWLIFYTHSWNTAEFDTTYMGTVIDYVKSLNIPILTVGEAEKIKGNAISAGEYTGTKKFFVGKDGNAKITSDMVLIPSLAPDNGLTIDSPLFSFDVNRISVFRVRSGSGNDPLTGEGGVVKVYNYGDGTKFNYEEYVSVTTNRKFVRRWIDDSDSWGTWKEMASVNDLSFKVVQAIYTDTVGNTMDDPITKFNNYKVTIVQIRSGATDTLTGEGGTLQVFRGAPYFNYQIFVSASSGRMYYRKWNGADDTGSWGEWKQFAIEKDNEVRIIEGLYTDTAGNTMDDPVTKFEAYKVTYVHIKAGATDPLTGQGGTLVTYRGDPKFSYQMFYAAGSERTFRRRWVETGTPAWGAWKEFSMI